jgi:hypothetical protein
LPFTVVGQIESEYLNFRGTEKYDHLRKYEILEIEEQDTKLEHEIQKLKIEIYDLTMEL